MLLAICLSGALGALGGALHGGGDTGVIPGIPSYGSGAKSMGSAPVNDPLGMIRYWGQTVLSECQSRGYSSDLAEFPFEGADGRACTDDVWIAKCYLARRLSSIKSCTELLNKHQNLCEVWPETIQNYCCATTSSHPHRCHNLGMAGQSATVTPWNKGVAQMYLPRGRILQGLQDANSEPTESSTYGNPSRELRRKPPNKNDDNTIREASLDLPHLSLKITRGNPSTLEERIMEPLVVDNPIVEKFVSTNQWDELLDERDLDIPTKDIIHQLASVQEEFSSVFGEEPDHDEHYRLPANVVIVFPGHLQLCSLVISGWKTLRLIASLYDVRDVLANRQWETRDNSEDTRYIDQFGPQFVFKPGSRRRSLGEPCEAGFVKFSHQMSSLGISYASGEISFDEAKAKLVELIDENFRFLNGEKIRNVDYVNLKQTLRYNGFVSEAFLIAPGCWPNKEIYDAMNNADAQLSVNELIPRIIDMLEYLQATVSACEDNCLEKIWQQVEELSGVTDQNEAAQLKDWFLDNLAWLIEQTKILNVDPDKSWGELLVMLSNSLLPTLAGEIDENQMYRANMAYKFLLALGKDVKEAVPTLGLEVHKFIRNTLKCGRNQKTPRILLEGEKDDNEDLDDSLGTSSDLFRSLMDSYHESDGQQDKEIEHQGLRDLRRVGGFTIQREIKLGERLKESSAEQTSNDGTGKAQDFSPADDQSGSLGESKENPADLRQLPRKVVQTRYRDMFDVAVQREKTKGNYVDEKDGSDSDFGKGELDAVDRITDKEAKVRSMGIEDGIGLRLPGPSGLGPAASVPISHATHPPPQPNYNAANPSGVPDIAAIIKSLTGAGADLTQLVSLLSLVNSGDGLAGTWPSTITLDDYMAKPDYAAYAAGMLPPAAFAANHPLENRLKPLVPVSVTAEEKIQGFACVDKWPFMFQEFGDPWIVRANCFDLISAFGCKAQRGGSLMPLQILLNACPHTWIRGCSTKTRHLQTEIIGASVDGRSISGPQTMVDINFAEGVAQPAALIPLKACLKAATRSTQEIDRDKQFQDLFPNINDEFSDKQMETAAALDRVYKELEDAVEITAVRGMSSRIVPAIIFLYAING